MILPDGVLKSVAFLCYRDSEDKVRFAGTAFFVIDVLDNDRGVFTYTVTALHVIVKISEISKDGRVILRVNKVSGGVEEFENHFSDWEAAFTEDAFTDLAILQGAPSNQVYDVMPITLNIAVTQDLLDRNLVSIGNETIIVGLFVSHTGTMRNVPIVRYGNIAMLPDEFVTTKLGKMKGYLVESRSIGGLSGSPVFVYTDRPITRSTPTGSISERRVLWLGFIHGHYDVPFPAEDTLVEDVTKDEAINMGIAIVVPSIKVVEMIRQNIKIQRTRKPYLDEQSESHESDVEKDE